MKKIIFIWLLMCPITTVLASIQASPRSSIKKIISYTERGGGDVLVQLTKNGSHCSSGYWLSKSDPGFRANYAMLIAAFQSNMNSVIIEGHSYQLWSGSAAGIYCHISNVQYSNE
jgi:hypothetical protein